MLAKINVSANAKRVPVAATAGAASGYSKEERNSDSGASFHMLHTQSRMTVYKKAPARTTFEVIDGTILSVDRFGTAKVDLD